MATSSVNNLITENVGNKVSIKSGVTGWVLDAAYLTRTGSIVAGLVLMHTTAQWPAQNNNAILEFAEGIRPKFAYVMAPAFATASQFNNTSEMTNVAYLNASGALVLNWSSAIASGKYVKIMFSYAAA